MNAVEIEQAITDLAAQPFDAAEFPYAFLEAFGNKSTTIKRLRAGASNKSDVGGAALRTQSLDRQPQLTVPTQFTLPIPLEPERIRDILAKRMHPQALAEHQIEAHGVPEDEALAHARGFLRDLFRPHSPTLPGVD